MDLIKKNLKIQMEPKKGESHIDGYHMMVVMKYLPTDKDLYNVVSVKKLYELSCKRMNENPIELNTEMAKKLFSHVQTVVIRDVDMIEDYYKEALKEKKKRDDLELYDLDTLKELPIILTQQQEQQLSKLSKKEDVQGISMYNIGELLLQEYPSIHNIKVKVEENVPRFSNTEKFLMKNDPQFGTIRDMENTPANVLVVPDEWKVIPKEGFRDTHMLFIQFGSNISIIRDYAFYRCSELLSVTIPSSVMYLGRAAFGSCHSLEIVNFQDNSRLQYIGKFCFMETKIKRIHIPDSCETIDNEAFWACTNLEYVKLPAHLLYLGNKVFEDCKKLTKKVVNLPDGYEMPKNYKHARELEEKLMKDEE